MPTTTMTLPVTLTEPELLDRGQALAAERERFTASRAAAKAAATAAKDDMAEIEAEVDRLAGIVARKSEPRPVACEVRADYPRGVMETIRLDTGEIAYSRSLTETERQAWLFPGPVPTGPAEAAAVTVEVPGEESVAVENPRRKRVAH
jgi:hypothetical protein